MIDENFSMKRSRAQLATVYAPGTFFTFEGGMGACMAQPAARVRADLSLMLKNQIVDSINERVRSWDIQGMTCRRAGDPPPVQREVLQHSQPPRPPDPPRPPAPPLELSA